MVREFKLLNEKGQTFPLMDIDNYCLLTEPGGLGYSYQTEYERVGNTFIESFRAIQQEPINGTLNFSSYDNYKNFVDFVENSETLRLAYKIPSLKKEKEYLKDVQIQSLGKTQKQTNGILSEPIVIDCKSLWYEENTTIYNIEPTSNEMRWNFRWESRFKDYNSRSIEYKNVGHVEAPILLEIEGPVNNPKIEIYIENQLYQRVTLTTNITEYEKLLYSSKENEFYINKQNTDGTIESLFNLDVLNFQEEDEVVRLPKNIDCKIQISADNTIQRARLTILPQFFAV